MLKLFAHIFRNWSVEKIEVIMSEERIAVGIRVRVLSKNDFDDLEKFMAANEFSFNGIAVENDYFKIVFVKDLKKEEEDC